MKFSYSAIWDDTVRMMRSDSTFLLALAGVFLFLPALLIGYFLPQPESAPTLEAMIADMEAYLAANWHWVLLANLANMIGAIAMLALLLGERGRTVGSAIGAALPLLPFYLIAAWASSLLIAIGFIFLILPGLYLYGRLAIVGPVVVAEERNPFRAIGRSFALTKGKGWAVLGLILIIAIVGLILTLVVTSLLGGLFVLVLSESLGGLIALIIEALTAAVFSTVLVVLYAAIYRALAAPAQASAVPPTH